MTTKLNGMILSGHDALKDTIKDMVVAISGCSNIIFLVKIRPFKNMKIVVISLYQALQRFFSCSKKC